MVDRTRRVAAGGGARGIGAAHRGGRLQRPARIARNDELGQLSGAFANMAEAIREREAHIRHQAGHDQVTGLPNRVDRRSGHPAANWKNGKSAALLMVGLARVPEIIKTMGHAVCDRLIRDVGGRIRSRSATPWSPARPTRNSRCWLPAAGRQQAIAAALPRAGRVDEPYREADLTLDRRARGRHRAGAAARAAAPTACCGAPRSRCSTALGTEEPIGVYDPDTDPHRPERLSLMGDLREALDRDQLELHYQPKLDLASRPHRRRRRPDSLEPSTASAWCRRMHFIALAEETGNIRRLTRWALAAGIAQAAALERRGRGAARIASISPRAISTMPNCRARVGGAARRCTRCRRNASRWRSPKARSWASRMRRSAILRRLADRGIDLAIDDFGVGQSSLRLPAPAAGARVEDRQELHPAVAGQRREDQTIVRCHRRARPSSGLPGHRRRRGRPPRAALTRGDRLRPCAGVLHRQGHAGCGLRRIPHRRHATRVACLSAHHRCRRWRSP